MLRSNFGRCALFLALASALPALAAETPVSAAAGVTAAPVPPAEPAAPMPASPTDADLQVALARSSFSPGEIDGRGGVNTRKALRAFQGSRSLVVTGSSSDETRESLWTASGGPTLVSYTITADDAAAPYLTTIPEAMDEKAVPDPLVHPSPLEMLGERFQAAPDFLRRINQGASFAAGDEVKVPNTRLQPVPVEAGDVRVVVSGKAGPRTSARDGRFFFSPPPPPGGAPPPLPVGDWKVKGVARDPS